MMTIKKWVLKNIFRKKYIRTGHCNACGRCCKQIYVKHGKTVIQTEEELERLKLLHSFYTHLEPMGKDELGLILRCTNLDEETHKCKIHKNRPAICRQYPQEGIFSMGGALSENCGYKLEPIESFDEVFKKVQKQGRKSKLMR